MPHDMKRYYFFILALVALVATACDWTSVVSPRISASQEVYRTSAAGVRDTITLRDSLSVGDTAQLRMVLYGYYDYIVSFEATADTSKVKLALDWPDSLGCTTPDSDPAHAKLVFKPDSVYNCITTLSYMPVDSGSCAIKLVLTSAAKAPYSQTAAQFYIAVKK